MSKGHQIVFLIAWLCLLGVCFWKLGTYSNITGEAARICILWPVDSFLIPDHNSSTLVIFAHPHCLCSRASIGELERIVARIWRKVKIIALFIGHSSESKSWARASLWERAKTIPEVQVLIDEGGIDATRLLDRYSVQDEENGRAHR